MKANIPDFGNSWPIGRAVRLFSNRSGTPLELKVPFAGTILTYHQSINDGLTVD
jgi:hypothetical protein